MSYSYEKQRPSLFTDDGVKMLLKIRDTANRLLDEAGAFRAEKAWAGLGGNVWDMIAALDYLVERGEIVEVSTPGTWGQSRIFVRAKP